LKNGDFPWKNCQGPIGTLISIINGTILLLNPREIQYNSVCGFVNFWSRAWRERPGFLIIDAAGRLSGRLVKKAERKYWRT
jgi:hypothetical protein